MSTNLFICKICHKSFKSIHSLRIHIGQYEKISKEEYLIKYENIDLKCPICKIRNRVIDKQGRILKTCCNPICTQKLRDETSYKNTGLTIAQKGANANKNKWLNEDKEKLNTIIEHRKQTFFSRYGVYHALQNSNFLEKQRKTCKERYGVYSYSMTDVFKKFMHEYMLQDENIKCLIEKCKQTCLKKYGVENISQLPEIKRKKLEKYKEKTYEQKLFYILKSQETQRKKYNGLLWCQTYLGHKKHHGILMYDNIIFDSKDEIKIYKFCKANNLFFIYHPDKIFLYTGVDNKIHAYHPDFYINGKYFEIKGSQFFNEEGNLFCPYARNKPDILIRDGNARCKQKIIEENNIIIIKDGNVEILKEYI